MNIRDIIYLIKETMFPSRKCPKCGYKMRRSTVKSNDRNIDGSVCLECTNCHSFIINYN